jgi:hypothetical protein
MCEKIQAIIATIHDSCIEVLGSPGTEVKIDIWCPVRDAVYPSVIGTKLYCATLI